MEVPDLMSPIRVGASLIQAALLFAESSQLMDKAAGVGDFLRVKALCTEGTGTGTNGAAILLCPDGRHVRQANEEII